MRIYVRELRKIEDVTLEEFNDGIHTFTDDDIILLDFDGDHIIFCSNDGFKFDEVSADFLEPATVAIAYGYYTNVINLKNGTYDTINTLYDRVSELSEELIDTVKYEYKYKSKKEKEKWGTEVCTFEVDKKGVISDYREEVILYKTF